MVGSVGMFMPPRFCNSNKKQKKTINNGVFYFFLIFFYFYLNKDNLIIFINYGFK
jgi:hypothetical protein